MFEIVRHDSAGHLSAVVEAAGLVFVSGQVADDLSGDIDAQCAETLAKLNMRLIQGGSSREGILFAMVWLKDIAQRDSLNRIWNPWVAGKPPSRACVQAELADARMLVEIAAVAMKHAA